MADTAGDGNYTLELGGGASVGGGPWYTFPNPPSAAATSWSPATYTSWTVPQTSPNFCICGGKTTQEMVVVEEKRIPIGADKRRKITVVNKTRQAVVCEKCGVIAWFGHDKPPEV